jgi:hypothetical protein
VFRSAERIAEKVVLWEGEKIEGGRKDYSYTPQEPTSLANHRASAHIKPSRKTKGSEFEASSENRMIA